METTDQPSPARRSQAVGPFGCSQPAPDEGRRPKSGVERNSDFPKRTTREKGRAKRAGPSIDRRLPQRQWGRPYIGVHDKAGDILGIEKDYAPIKAKSWDDLASLIEPSRFQPAPIGRCQVRPIQTPQGTVRRIDLDSAPNEIWHYRDLIVVRQAPEGSGAAPTWRGSRRQLFINPLSGRGSAELRWATESNKLGKPYAQGRRLSSLAATRAFPKSRPGSRPLEPFWPSVPGCRQ